MLALLYDVHGNLPALEAVLADAQAAGAGRYLLGGDYAAFGAWPSETIARLRELDADWIRGNVDRWTAGDDHDLLDPMRPAIARCRELLGDDLATELGALPETLTAEDVLYCHASPMSDMDSFMPEAREDKDAERLMGVGTRRVVFGHTHLAFKRTGPAGIELVNPGSVGIPLDGDHRPSYGLVREDGEVELRRVAYDHQASADAIREVLGEAGEIPARRIEQARFDVQ
ncbi:MAG TPA: metallophosphoesterase family protein [Thermoleophilaceae bacterium]|jgi:diadenosine tetraphosphatase ApaH/serine/threonine PP2A family protein phosphatase